MRWVTLGLILWAIILGVLWWSVTDPELEDTDNGQGTEHTWSPEEELPTSGPEQAAGDAVAGRETANGVADHGPGGGPGGPGGPEPGSTSTTESVEPRTVLIRMVEWMFPEDPMTALAIVGCESAWNPTARSATGDTGLFQINDIHRSPGGVAEGMTVEDLQDPATNVLVARRLFDQSGWAPWVCYGGGR